MSGRSKVTWILLDNPIAKSSEEYKTNRHILLITYIRHFSHVTKRSIFKNLNLKRKTGLKFQVQAPKIMFKSTKLFSLRSMSFVRKDEVHISDRANLSGFATWEFSTKEDLNPRKQVHLLNLRFWLLQKTKLWSILYVEMFILLYQCHRYFFISYYLVASVWHLKRSSIWL